jgi:hypothetical protein
MPVAISAQKEETNVQSAGSYLSLARGGIVVGPAEAMVRRIESRPTYCASCCAQYCLACVFKASKDRGLTYYCCPDCGNEVPDDYPF